MDRPYHAKLPRRASLPSFWRRCFRAAILSIAAGCTALASTVFAAEEGATAPPAERASISIPAQAPVGIVAQGGRMWVVDAGTGEVLELNPKTGELIRKLKTNLRQPKGLAFDGKRLWVADQETRQLVAFDVAGGKQVKAVALRWPEERGFKSIEALAWDGQTVWTAISAGFSSTFNQVDTETGKIVRSLFADCDPRGMAFSGNQLFSLCFNGEKNPASIDRRQMSEREVDTTSSRRLLQRLEVGLPAGLAYDGSKLWVLDARAKQAVGVPVEADRQK
jgi:hypothetical protein